MPTVEEVLRESGFTAEQIAALEPKAITAFSGVLSAADKERAEAKAAQDAAELAQRSNVDFYENRIAPSLVAWEEEKQKLENASAKALAEAAFYRTQAEEAKKSGFILAEAPGFDASKFVPPNPNPANGGGQRDAQGRYVANAPGGTPGSPQFFDVNKVYERAGDAVGVIADIQWEHQRLYGKPLPISPTELVRQADAVKLDPKVYAARTFNFDARRQQMAEEEAKVGREKIAAEAVAPWEQKLKEEQEASKKALADNDRKWAERVGSNPDVRMPQTNAKMTDINRAVKANEMPDPLSLNDQQRRALTSQMIRKDISESAA
jgi:hypothetical protein